MDILESVHYSSFLFFAGPVDFGPGIILAFLPFILFFLLIGIISLWSFYKLSKLYVFSLKNKKDSHSYSAHFKLAALSLLLGVLYLLRLRAERSETGLVSPILKLLPSGSDEWASLHYGIVLLITAFVLSIALKKTYVFSDTSRSTTKAAIENRRLRKLSFLFIIAGLLSFTAIAPAAMVTLFIIAFLVLHDYPRGSQQFTKYARIISVAFILLAALLTFSPIRHGSPDCDKSPFEGTSPECMATPMSAPKVEVGGEEFIIATYASAGLIVFILSTRRTNRGTSRNKAASPKKT